MKNEYDIEYILHHLPQKYPFLMVDRVLEYERGKSIKTRKNVTINEEFFVGHFPERKIMPGVLLCEALAQTCALLGILDAEQRAAENPQEQKAVDFSQQIGMLAAIKVKFVKTVVPGDCLELTARVAKVFGGLLAYDVCASVDGVVAAEGQIHTTVRT